ncbi:MAG: hemolysin III family protein, partial [Patescibacteria group bacterium]
MDKLLERDRSNDIVSGILHLVGVLLAVAVLVVLIVLGSYKGNSWHVIGYSLYGSGLILLYLASASYHLIPYSWPRLKHMAQRFDHAMIYILIAATYTPIAFIVLSGGWRWSLFGVIWGLAIIGATIKFLWLRVSPVITTILYIIMGWLGAIALSPLIHNMTATAFWLLILGGLSYTFGVVFFTLEHVLPQRKYFWMH